MKKSFDTILVDYYTGSYGPTIRFDIKTISSLLILKELFQKLATSTNSQKIDIVDIPNVEAIGLVHLFFEMNPNREKKGKGLQKISGQNGKNIFIWECTRDEWNICGELVEGLIEHGSGHQYLTQEGIDDALVEVSFMES